MKINYRKNISQSYMVISEIEDLKEDDFASRLLKKGHVPHLLDLESEVIDSAACLLYDISGKQSFEKTFETDKMSYRNLCSFIDSLQSLTESMADYLLDCDSILMEPGTIFTNHEKNKYYFCYYPPASFNFQVQLRNLFANILSLIDYDDAQAVTLAFSLSRISQSDSFTITDIKEAFNKPEDSDLIYDRIIADKSLENEDHLSPESSSGKVPAASSLKGENPSFIGKARNYFESNKFTDIIDDINSGKIIKRIKSQPVACYIPKASPDETAISFNEDSAYSASTVEKTFLAPADAPAVSEEIESETQSLSLSPLLSHKLIGSGKAADTIITIDDFPFSIGKSPSCNYRLCIATISRVHCRFYIDPDNPDLLYIEDMNSTNGTFVNDIRLNPYEKYPLNKEDTIRLSEITFVFR